MVFWSDFLVFLIDALMYFYRRNEDLKQMLESNKDSAKLDAMKRIVGVCDFFCCCYCFYLLRGMGAYYYFYVLDRNNAFFLQIL